MAMVLCTGANSALLETRKLILERAGHTVVSARDENTLAAACKQFTFDVAVIGQSISASNRRAMATTIRRHCPSVKILELHALNEARVVEFADSWLEVPADVPQELAERVMELANAKGQKLVGA